MMGISNGMTSAEEDTLRLWIGKCMSSRWVSATWGRANLTQLEDCSILTGSSSEGIQLIKDPKHSETQVNIKDSMSY